MLKRSQADQFNLLESQNLQMLVQLHLMRFTPYNSLSFQWLLTSKTSGWSKIQKSHQQAEDSEKLKNNFLKMVTKQDSKSIHWSA